MNADATIVSIFDTEQQVAQAAAERLVMHGNEAISHQGQLNVALSGGKTPGQMYDLLASDSFRTNIDWPLVHLFFGDERCVPRDHTDSNYRLAYERLISPAGIPTENVHRIKGENGPEEGTQLYEAELRRFFPGSDWPRFDLVLLGLGNDGHTASLFPHTAALKETRAWVVASLVETQGTPRISLSAPAINAAHHVVFMVTGVDKSGALARVLEGPYDPNQYPAQLIKPASGSLVWLVDAQAAAKLTRTRS